MCVHRLKCCDVNDKLLQVASEVGSEPLKSWNPESYLDMEEWCASLLKEINNTVVVDEEASVANVVSPTMMKDELLALGVKALQMKVALSVIIPWAQDCRAEAVYALEERDEASNL